MPVEPAVVDTTITLQDDTEQLHSDVKKLMQELFPDQWGSVDADRMQIKKIGGGITNVLLKVEAPKGAGIDSVIVRVFGDNTEIYIDREREIQVLLRLNEAGFGAQVLGTFGNGRVERFMEGMRHLDPAEMARPDLVPLIARRLAQFHAVALGEDEDGEPQVFAIINKWLKEARGLKFDDPKKQAAFEKWDLDDLAREIAVTQAACERLESPVVCSHNDLLSGNIMIPHHADRDGADGNVGADSLQFIDFEYGCVSYRGFDWGNHFNEYAGFECDYGRYPDGQGAASFIRHYLAEAHGGREPVRGLRIMVQREDEAEVDRAVTEANVFALASHQYWGTWALLQARYSPIDFDYLGYAELRWGEYRRRKADFLPAAEAVGR